jgi:oligogalacturonide transporter
MPVVLVALLFLFGYLFPMKQKEFNVIQRENRRRRGEDSSVATEEEKKICERVTGIPYQKLWHT